MSEIDMIPREYRAAMRARRYLRVFFVLFLLVPLMGAGARAVMNWRLAHGEAQLIQLRSATALALSGIAAIDAARAHKAVISEALVSLAALRGAGDAVRIADSIEAALSPQLSLDQISFSREAQLLAPSTASAGQLVLSPLSHNGAGAETWQLSRRLEILGVAAGYPALTSFVDTLSTQRGFAQVRLVRSSAVAPPAGLQLAATVRSDAGVQFTVNAALERLP